jgi:hypothetical protein
MKTHRIALALAAAELISLCASPPRAAADPAGPHLEQRGAALQLVVRGQPFLVLGGELRNSSSSSLAYLEPIWPRLAARHLNTVLAPISWEQFEPIEGAFDDTLVDGLIKGAREHQLHLVLLWFGSWKNLVSSYAPAWVRGDPSRFPRVRDEAGRALPVLSAFAPAGRLADARAFSHLLQHLREVDATEQTVLMVQVENEVGVPEPGRDHSEAANAAFAAVPAALTDYLASHHGSLNGELRALWEAGGARRSGSWEEVFGAGPATNALFMAWHYARYIEGVAAAGEGAYPLPLLVNAAIGRQDGKIGSYPSGGVLPVALNLWQAGAPHVAICSPDIYFGNFSNWCERYVQSGNPLFIPEMAGGEIGAGHAFLAVGRYRAIGISPFGIDGAEPFLLGAAPAAPGPRTDSPRDDLGEAYSVLAQLSPLILAGQREGRIGAADLGPGSPTEAIALGGCRLEIRRWHDRRAHLDAEHGYALVIAETDDSFIVAGKNVDVTFSTREPGEATVEFAQVEEGRYQDGRWIPGRRLNGDETMLDYDLSALAAKHQAGTGLHLGADGPVIVRVRVFRVP